MGGYALVRITKLNNMYNIDLIMSSSHNDRQKELDNVIKQSNVKTDEFIKRENDKIRQFYEDKFKQELIMYQECEKLGDFI